MLGDPGARSSTRRARAFPSRRRGPAFARELRPVSHLVHASGTCRAKAGACGSRLAGPSCGKRTLDRRNRHRLVPASSGVKAPLACEDRALDGCARASDTVAEVGERRRGPEKRDSPLATGHVDGDQDPQVFRKESPGAQTRRTPARRWPSRGAGRGRSRALERASRGEGLRSMEGTLGRSKGRLVHASGPKATSAAPARMRDRASVTRRVGEATGVSEVRFARTEAGRQRPPR